MLPGKTYAPLDYVAMAWRRRWLIFGSLIVGAYAALIASSFMPDMYQSEMLIQVVPQRVPDNYVRSTVTMRTEDRLNTLTQQVLSRTALEGLIRQMSLYPKELAEKPFEDVVELMRKNIIVEPVISPVGRDADAFHVRFTYPDRDTATRVTERLGGLFIDLNARDRGDLAQATDDFLQSQLNETRVQLEAQERKLEQFRQQNAGRLPTQLTFNMQAMQNTQMAIQATVESLARDRDRRLMQERLYNEAMAAQPSVQPLPPATAAAQQPDIPASGLTTEQQLVAAREALARLQLRLKPAHPDITRTTRLIETLEARLLEEASLPAEAQAVSTVPVVTTPEQEQRRERLAQMRAELDSLDRQIAFKEAEEQRQRSVLGEYQRRIEEVPGVESEWVALTRDYDTQQAAYNDLLAKSGQSKVAVQLERRQIGEQFRVLDPASPPIRPSGIPRIQINIAGGLVGLFLGLVVAALLEYRDATFRSGADVADVLKLPVVAMVPFVLTSVDRAVAIRRKRLTSAAVTAVVVAGVLGAWSLELWRYIV